MIQEVRPIKEQRWTCTSIQETADTKSSSCTAARLSRESLTDTRLVTLLCGAALMRSARQELCKAEEYARLVQGIDARIDKMRLDLEAMHLQALELRVQAAIAGNRLVRLDNPVIAAKMASLHESLLEMLLEP